MPSALQAIEFLLVDKFLSGNLPLASKRSNRQGIFALSALLGGVGLCFLTYAAYTWLSLYYSPTITMAYLGGLAIALSLLILCLVALFEHYRQSQIKKYQQKITQKIQGFLATLNDELGEPITSNPKLAVLLATAAGYFLEEKLYK